MERVGIGSKMVLLGDTKQIDNEILAQNKNGLIHALYIGYNPDNPHPRFAHLKVNKNYRSQTAEISRGVNIYDK